MKSDTKKELSLIASEKFGRYSVNEFLKKCLRLAIDKPDFFFDTLTNVVGLFYDRGFGFDDVDRARSVVRSE